MQDILCRLESNRSRFRSYAPTAVPNPLQASALICPGFSFFYTFFSSSLSLHRHLSESFSLGINPGWERRAERLQCSCRPVHPELVLFVSDCCFCCLIDKCKFVFKHIFSSFLQLYFFVTYTVCGNFEAWIFFCGFFFVWWICRKNTEFGWEFGLYTKKQSCTCCQAVFAAWKRNRKAEHNARTGGSVQQSIYCRL